MNAKKFLVELKRRNVSESRDRKRGYDADQQYCSIKGVFVRGLYGAVVYSDPRKFNVVVQEFVQKWRGFCSSIALASGARAPSERLFTFRRLACLPFRRY